MRLVDCRSGSGQGGFGKKNCTAMKLQKNLHALKNEREAERQRERERERERETER